VHVSAVVEVSDGAVELGGRPILRGIDLTVRCGDVVAVLGANGSGKSTLVRAVTGLVPVSRGSVALFGTALSSFRDWRRIGFVPQRATAAAGVPASVWEVVSSGRLSRRRIGLPVGREDRAAVRRAIADVELSERTHDSVSTLSGGQQQRVLIARALAGEPDLLVLDEPTAGVDVESRQTFAGVLAALVDRGTTILLVAHELGPIEPLIGRTVVMRDGRIAYDGAPVASFRDTHPHPAHHPALEAQPPTDHNPSIASPMDRG
jgi:zinc transport system ATP-binding protein